MLKVTKKGLIHSPRVGNFSNTLSWVGIMAATAKGTKPATVAQLIGAVQVSNPTNVGNAVGYVKYQQRLGNLIETK